MKKIYKSIFVLMAILFIATSAYALESKVVYRENGLAAHASWYDEIPGATVYKDLSVTKTNDATDIYMSTCTYDYVDDIYSCKVGYKYTTEKVASIDKRLNGAKLLPVDITLYDLDTGTEETVSLKAEWTGIGYTTKGSYKFTDKSGNYVSKYSSGSSFRNAVATASINSQSLGTSDYGRLVAFKSTSMTMVK